MNLPKNLSWLSSLILPLVAVATHAASLAPSSLTLPSGASATIAVSNVSGTANLANSDPTVVSASLAGRTIRVSANAIGVATLSVTDRRGTKTAKITVTPPLSVSPGSASLLVGRSTTLVVSNAIGSITVTNSNSTAVGTSRSGNTITVTGRSEGSGLLTVRDSRSTVKVQVDVTALPPASSGEIHPGRLLASNCFQCDGTNGSGGFDELRGKNKAELLDELRGFASGREDAGGIMAAHATGYTDEQLQLIADFLSRQ